jgi:hypothetical protein
MGHPEQSSSSGSNAGIVILIAVVVLAVPCVGGLFLAGLGFFWVSVDQPPAQAVQGAPPVQVASEQIVEPAPVQLPDMSTEPAPELPTETEPATEGPAGEVRGPEPTPPAGASAAGPE